MKGYNNRARGESAVTMEPNTPWTAANAGIFLSVEQGCEAQDALGITRALARTRGGEKRATANVGDPEPVSGPAEFV